MQQKVDISYVVWYNRGMMKKDKEIKDYPETHQLGIISIENMPEQRIIKGDLGVQIAKDGRVWVCIDGIAFIRFKPKEDGHSL